MQKREQKQTHTHLPNPSYYVASIFILIEVCDSRKKKTGHVFRMLNDLLVPKWASDRYTHITSVYPHSETAKALLREKVLRDFPAK